MTPHAQRQANAIQAMTAEQREYALGRLQGELYTSANGGTQQARRLRSGEQVGPEYLADGRAFAYLLRDVIRIAEVCELVADADQAAAIREALDRVSHALPRVVDARNALEHCDDYILQIGHQQRIDPEGSFAQHFRRENPPIIQVGDIAIDVDLAERAAQHLAAVTTVGTDYLDLLPTGEVD